MSGKAYKKEKYGERILNELNAILRREISDSRLKFASITKVELNCDCSTAKVYWDTFDANKRGEIKKAMQSAEGRMRSLLCKALQVRTVPVIELIYDSQFEEEQKISEILNDEEKIGKSFS